MRFIQEESLRQLPTILAIIVAGSLASIVMLCTSGACFAASSDGTTIPSATQIADSNGGVWTVGSNRLCYLNGTQAGNCKRVKTLLWYQGNMYVDSMVGAWWQWNGSGWAQIATDPRTAAQQPGANLAASLAASQAAPYYSCVTNWYVDAVNGSDGYSGTSASAAFRTIARATRQNTKLAAGGCVNVAPGTYNEFVTLTNVANQGGNLNSLTGFVVLRSTTPLAAKIVGPSSGTNNIGTNAIVEMPASFVVIDGFDVSGSGGGTCIDGAWNYTAGNHPHHLIVVNNNIHGCGGAGIGFGGGDYYIVANNIVNNNAATSQYHMSGIDIYSAVAATGFTSTAADNAYYHNIIRNNISYNNVETWSCAANGQGPGCHTDGEGIIIDCFDCNGVGIYTAKTLIVGNLVYGNGGNGIQVGRSSWVTVANNTSYGNFTDTGNSWPYRAELANNAAGNTIWVNNIAYAGQGTGSNYTLYDSGAGTEGGAYYPEANVLWNNNIYYGAGVGFWGNANISTTTNFNENPGLVSPGSKNFSLTASSPALNAGLPEGFLSSITPNIGAY
jgi:serralysin